jgi:hypothetical protein
LFICNEDSQVTTKNRINRQILAVALAAASLSLSSLSLAESYQLRVAVPGLKEAVPEITTTFESHTFTTCGKSGRYGPSLSQCQSAYSGSEIMDPEYGFDVSQGVQE